MEKNQEFISTDGAISELILTTSYKIENFYRYSIFQGGLTREQFNCLYDAYQTKIVRDREFLAAIHGVTLEKSSSASSKDQQSATSKVPLFGDPEDYKDLSEQEKEELTQKMIGQHKVWADNPSI